nr:MAG TPA: hypothetical protein [Caudoviricetes sp.]
MVGENPGRRERPGNQKKRPRGMEPEGQIRGRCWSWPM